MQSVKQLPKVGDVRIKSGFLFLPNSVYGKGYEESRWLEFATWEEIYTRGRIGWFWKTTRFLK